MLKLLTSILCFLTLFLLPKGENVEKDPKNWWKTSVLYQIYPRSFMDSDGDGVGDLAGITPKLEYFKYLGVDVTWLSPIYTSPMKDFGYDVENYVEIDPLFGTMEDFSDYVNRSKELGLKVILDFVPNHSSNTHEWFLKSERREGNYTDYYLWADGKGINGTERPNNWLSVFGGPGWTWSPIRQQFYYHQFLVEQPDLNFRDPLVRDEFKKVLTFWLEAGVDGFRVDAPRHLFEDKLLRDEPRNNYTSVGPWEHDYLDHIYTQRLPEIYDVIAEWRQLLNDFEHKDGLHRLMMVESIDNIHNSLPYFGNDSFPLADMPFNFELISWVKKDASGYDVYKAVTGWLDYLPETKWSNWIVGNHDNPRIANRTHEDLIDAFNMIYLLLRGTPITYYGEEIGMVDRFISWDEIQDPNGKWAGPENYTKFNRDPERTPMQWSDEKYAGFTTGNSTWLPVNENYIYLNVEKQKSIPRSHLNTYRRLVGLKKEQSFINGSIEFPVITEEIFSFTRTSRTAGGYVIVVNMSNKTADVNLANKKMNHYRFSSIGIIKVMSDNLYPSVREYDSLPIDLSEVELPPRQGVVIMFDPEWFD